MKQLLIKNTKYTIPQSWGDVNVSRFENMQRIVLQKIENVTENELKIVGALIDCEYDVLKSISKKLYSEIESELSFVYTPPKNAKKDVYEIKGVEYKRILDLTDLNMGDMIDLETIIKHSDDVNVTSNILPFLIRRFDGDDYIEMTKKEYKANLELFKNTLSIEDALFTVNFF